MRGVGVCLVSAPHECGVLSWSRLRAIPYTPCKKSFRRASPPSLHAVPMTPPTTTNPDRWVDEHGDCLYRYALLRVRRPELAEDLVQETLLIAVRTRESFAGRSSERSWLVGILKNKVCDHFRKAGRETSFTDLEFFDDEHSDKFDGQDFWIHERGPIEWQPEGRAALDRAEFWAALRECLGKLPQRVADVFMLREIEEVDSRHVCATLNISESNLWVMLHRARMALRQCLELNFFGGAGATKL
jgi:RNA polymerase sigma-70 factor, ECF subfamily